MEFSLFAPFGAHANIMAQLPARKPPDPSRVESPQNTEKARAHMHNATGDHAEAQQFKQTGQTKNSVSGTDSGAGSDPDPKDLTGPPPSFDLNVLEMDRKLQQQLALIETERAAADHTGLRRADGQNDHTTDPVTKTPEPDA